MVSILRRVWRRVEKRVRLTTYAAKSDCFLISYPKSGRTWFRYVLSHYLGAVSGVPEGIDLHNMFSIVPNFDLDPVRGMPGYRFRETKKTIPTILVSHLDYRASLFLRRPVIMMVRDPRDVIVSAYFHATRHKHRFAGSITEFIKDQDQGMPAMIDYLNRWAAGLSSRPHFVLSYEDLSADTEARTEAVLGFLGCPIDRTALRSAVAAGRFEAMQDRERVEGIPAHDYDRSDVESLRMRRGKAGGFRDYLDEAQVAEVERLCAVDLTAAAKRLVGHTGLNV
ncbi:sulfotransferase domain-containing protein [Sinorhizobium medicae]|uniref:sulfotransferase domain-containing protein n=1 Tax=Sinorhizobium medicae TaxID=110321 RepID=UPI000376A835|nr:sulfotransferase domain-containing protein [Sinorhizobium medicae]MDX0542100.1 sulfotransferase domain-containing protein [Sinorhizobium medicae]MDX0998095.1 sulfotransferase domain-containing protein [Sinorhizobium medicae]MDX1181745.1 sulfotransferase domain-containing protein [Sinorhizobium medicae]MQX96290.1 sulfotransferase domain-containing protein [Sinorhizobium medicae]RVI92271.1 sulfotransferase domain-containing protein [Sinorhizobium medicae]